MYKIGTATEKYACKQLKKKVWLPFIGSNHELDKILKSHNLLILKVAEALKSTKSSNLVQKVYKTF